MNQRDMAVLQDQIFEYCKELRKAGQAEYAHEESNAFRNFEDLADELGLDRKYILWIFMKKHLDGILSAIRGHVSQREPVQGRIADTIVYMTLLYGMFCEDQAPVEQLNQTYVETSKFAGGHNGMSEPPIVPPAPSLREADPVPADPYPPQPSDAIILEEFFNE